MERQEMNIAEAKAHFSEVINKVAYGHEEIVITKRGKPVAVISSSQEKGKGLADVKGWLHENDAFFKEIDMIANGRLMKKLRSAKGGRS